MKENTFTEHHTSKDIKIFKNEENHYCCIVFDEDKIDQALQKLNNTDGSYSFYIYSLGGETFDEELEDFISEHPNTISTPFHGELTSQWNYVLSMTMVTLLPIAIIFAYLQKFITTGIASTGMK